MSRSNIENYVRYNRLVEVMQSLQANLRQMSQRVGFNMGTLSSWRQNIHQPPVKTLYQIADAYEIDVRLLLMPNKRAQPIPFWEIRFESEDPDELMPINRLRDIFKERKFVVKDFAKQIERSDNSLYMWQANKSQPRVSELYRIADELEMDVRALLWPNEKARPADFWLLRP